jgi:hypothetical protein
MGIRWGGLLALLASACSSGESSAGLGPVPTGSLAIGIDGLPVGVSATVAVTGSQGYQKALSNGQTLSGLIPGSYSIVAAEVVHEGDRYTPAPASQNVAVTSGATPVTASVAYGLVTGRLAVTISGVPAGTAATVLVTGPGGYAHLVAASEVLSGLVPGTYSVQSPGLIVNGNHYDTPLTQQDVVVAAVPGATAQVALSYAVSTGVLQVVVAGLPVGGDAAVTVTGPGGFFQTVQAGVTINGLVPGNYSISAGNVTAGGALYVPAVSDQSAAVAPSLEPVVRTVTYSLATGAMSVTLVGLPSGAAGSVTVTGPGGFNQSITATQTLTNLLPGTYAVNGFNVVAGGTTYAPVPAGQSLAVSFGSTSSATVSYTPSTGSLALTISGLPGGTAANVTVTGPGGFFQPVTASQTLTGLLPGSYSLSAGIVSVGGIPYVPVIPQATAAISASATPVLRTVTYAPATGSLTVTLAGLPGGVPGNVTVTGPGGFSQSLTSSQTFPSLIPGSYTVSGLGVSSGGTTYFAVPSSQNVSVAAGPSSATVTYTATTGSLAVSISGLPGGTSANVTVTGPGGFSQHLTASQTLTGLLPGTYTTTAAAVSSGGSTYAPSPPSQSNSVAGGASVNIGVAYSVSTGALSVTIGGLPGGAAASVSVTGPGSFSQSLTASQTLSGLAPGAYTVAASPVVSGGTTYNPAPPSQAAPVSAGATTPASVVYSAGGGGATLNLTVNGVYLTQATQRYDGSVPLVAGRNAYLRVFALANQANTAQPPVRVRLYHGLVLVQTYTITAPAVGVPLAVSEGTLASSWNVVVPGALVQPNLKVLADVDPSLATAESNESDNQFPLSGTPGDVDVRALPTFNLRFVPVLQQVNGLQGNVTAGNKETFLGDLKLMLPVGAYDTDIRAPYTTTAPALVSDNSNGAWSTILSEVLALRSADANSRYYYGVVKTTYGSGVAGMGYVGGSARAAIGWDHLPSGSGVMAHELGHNMGRLHAPCGGVASPDPAFPHAGGRIGVWGLDLNTLALKNPATVADLMGYCSPSWVSDYNWSAMVTYRQGGPNNAPPAAGSGSGLLVWGRITDAGVVLEPSFRVPLSGRAPSPGAHRLELLASDGSLLQTVRFGADTVADLPGGAEVHFAFVIPLDATLDQNLAGLRVRAAGSVASRLALVASGDPAPLLTRPNARQVDVRWDAARYPMVMVRDAATGDILSFARGGSARLWTSGSDFVLQFSDGVKSVVRQRQLQ